MQNVKITIPKPCHESWDLMLPQDGGRHCAACNKVVIDFRDMSDSEILSILSENKNKLLCGRFKPTQVNRPLGVIPLVYKIPRWPSVAAMLVAGVFTLAPVLSHAQATPSVSKESSLHHETELLGNIMPTVEKRTFVQVKVKDFHHQTPILHAFISIEGVGQFNADKEGNINMSLVLSELPDTVQLLVVAPGYISQTITVIRKQASVNNNITLYMRKDESMDIVGELMIVD